jgi:hypothetical protein
MKNTGPSIVTIDRYNFIYSNFVVRFLEYPYLPYPAENF